jgi:hypothetical protein
MREFDSAFSARALWLFDELSSRGVLDGDRFIFEHPTNPLGVRDVAQTLATACDRLSRTLDPLRTPE